MHVQAARAVGVVRAAVGGVAEKRVVGERGAARAGRGEQHGRARASLVAFHALRPDRRLERPRPHVARERVGEEEDRRRAVVERHHGGAVAVGGDGELHRAHGEVGQRALAARRQVVGVEVGDAVAVGEKEDLVGIGAEGSARRVPPAGRREAVEQVRPVEVQSVERVRREAVVQHVVRHARQTIITFQLVETPRRASPPITRRPSPVPHIRRRRRAVRAQQPVVAAVRVEDEALAVRAPGGLVVREHVVGVVDDRARLQVQHVEVALRPVGAGERDAAAVRRKGHAHDGVEARHPVADGLARGHVHDGDGVRRPALYRHGEALAFRPPAQARREDAEALEGRRRLPVEQLHRRGVARGLGHVHVEQAVGGGEKRDAVAEGADGGARVVGAAVVAAHEHAPDAAQPLARGDLGEVDGRERLVPLVREVVQVEARRALESGAGRARGLEALDDLGDFLAPVLLGHEVPHALPAPVGEKASEALDVREPALQHGLAEVHVALGAPALRGVLGEALVKPERDRHRAGLPERGAHGAAVEEVVQHGVHQLVVDDLPESAPVAGEGHRDAVLEQLRHAADALGVHRQLHGVGDGEVVVALKNQKRNPVRDLGADERAHLRVRLLGRVGGDLREVGAAGLVEVHVDVPALEHLPVVALVLDAVFAEREVLRAGGGRARDEPEQGGQQADAHRHRTAGDARNVRRRAALAPRPSAICRRPLRDSVPFGRPATPRVCPAFLRPKRFFATLRVRSACCPR